jgi:putative ABC transport system permease protein
VTGTAAALPRPDRPQDARLPPRELFGVAMQGLRTRKLRAALSALGIAIGIGAMVAVVGVSASSQANLLATIDALGTNLLTVAPGTNFLGKVGELVDHAQHVWQRGLTALLAGAVELRQVARP